jgi:hypothetical protein
LKYFFVIGFSQVAIGCFQGLKANEEKQNAKLFSFPTKKNCTFAAFLKRDILTKVFIFKL